MNTLAQIIRREIEETKIISCARFMELALYHPELGYYEKKTTHVGRTGDFYTSVSVGGLFGDLLGCQFVPWLRSINSPRVQLVEAGAHDGRLAFDILTYLQKYGPDQFERLELWLLEPSANRQERQQATLSPFKGKVRWFHSWAEIKPGSITGIIYSNELLDAFPAQRLGWNAVEKRWFEWGVALDQDTLKWAKIPAATALPHPHVDLPPELQAVLPDGFTTEICPAANLWWEQAAQALTQGVLLTLDYGLTAEQFFEPHRVNGTLRAYRNHQVSQQIFEHPGEQDLTTHIDFTGLQKTGESFGLHTPTHGLSSQTAFLMQIYQLAVQQPASFPEWTPQRVRQFQTLTHPEHLGRSFSVLKQTRGINA